MAALAEMDRDTLTPEQREAARQALAALETGWLWALARDDRAWGGPDPPGVMYFYAPVVAANMPKGSSTALTAFCKSMDMPVTIG